MSTRLKRAALVVAAVLILPAAASAGSAGVPLKGSDAGDFGLGASCAASSFVVEIDGSGHASQVGAYEYAATECFNVVSLAYSGEFTITAANGDELSGTYAGLVHPTADPAVARYLQAGSITGGTGRFAGAAGTVTIDGVATFTSSAGGAYTQRISASLSKS